MRLSHCQNRVKKLDALVLVQFENAEGVGQFLALGWSVATTQGSKQNRIKPWKGLPIAEPFQGFRLFLIWYPGFSLALEPWAELANAFRRFQTESLQMNLVVIDCSLVVAQ